MGSRGRQEIGFDMIKSAIYGGVDVTNAVRSKVKNNKLSIRACNSVFGDTSPGVIKYLSIELDNGNIIKAKEGDMINYPEVVNDKLGIFYSNNINPETSKTIISSLKQLEKVSEGVADIYTCMWRSEPENPFREYIAWTQTYSHLNQLLQIMQLLYSAREIHDYEYVSFLEHDVMYGDGYFDFPEFKKGVVMTNMNYMGVNEFGFQPLGQKDEPFHQMTMHFDDAINHCENILCNALIKNSGLIEPQDMERKQWESNNPSIHVNHGHHFTSHYNVYRKDSYFHQHPYWGSHDSFKTLFSK
jgi:hypothetical protein